MLDGVFDETSGVGWVMKDSVVEVDLSIVPKFKFILIHIVYD